MNTFFNFQAPKGIWSNQGYILGKFLVTIMSLKKYRQKRDFKKTNEPFGKADNNTADIFVIQKHSASRLHYDFRIKINGVLKSWAVPKGFPEKTGEKNLAIATEDHPLEYADFEGNIPAGEYGAGTVELFDKGVFKNVTSKNGSLITIDKALKEGHLNILLEGEKIHGTFTLIRFKDVKRKDQWLLLKTHINRKQDGK